MAAGGLTAITGPSGCGKTTLARTIAGFIPSHLAATVEGDVRVGDLSSISADPARIAESVGMVQQDPDAQICTLRVRQEVAFGPENLCLPREQVEWRVTRSLRAAGIEHLEDRDTTTLSGGEKQRLAIASILAMDPPILLLDEPTANLDPEGAKAIFDALSDLRTREGRTVLVIEHRLAPLLPLTPNVWVMDRGRVVERRPTRVREDLVAMGLRSRWPRFPNGSLSKRPRLAADSVSYGYGSRRLFERFSVGVDSGEILGVIGPNGGGKTTLLRLMAGLVAPDDGRVKRWNVDRIGMLFQHPHQQIFERSVRREVEIEGPLTDDARRALLAAARLEGLDEAPPLSLSLGEQRRLTMITTLRRRPDLLLLDEPFIGQDRRNVAWIIEQIVAARERGASVVLVSHDVPLLGSLCDRLLFLGGETVHGSPIGVFDALRAQGRVAFTPEYWDGGDP